MTLNTVDPPFVSVVVPTHNRRALLRRVLAGLAEQTYSLDRFEVIVVVDGSDDGTDEMLASLRTPYPLRVLRQEQGGPAAARNAGIAAARGQAIIFLDDDVIPRPSLVRAHATLHERDDRAVVIGRILPCTKGSRPGWERWEEAIAERDYRQIRQGKVPVTGSLFYTWNASAARRCVEGVGGFDTALAYQEDVDLGHRLEKFGARFYFADDGDGYHCGHRPDFASWCRRHYRFGLYRLVMLRRAAPGQHRSLYQSYRDYNVLTRLLLRLVVGRPAARNVTAAALRAAVATTDRFRLWPISRCGYSALAVLHYWHGVEDGLGDGTALRRTLHDDVPMERRVMETG